MNDTLFGVLVGGAISLVGSAVIPWIRSTVERRSDRRETRRQELGVAIRDAIGAMLTQAAIPVRDRGPMPPLSAKAFLELELLTTKEERPILDMVLASSVEVNEHPERSAKVLATLARVLPAWRRGDLSVEDTVSLFVKETGIDLTKYTTD